MVCRNCGKTCGSYQLCIECDKLKKAGKITKCEDCGTWKMGDKPLCYECWLKNNKSKESTSKATQLNKDNIYIGRNAGKDLMKDIKSAKNEIKIVSPYLSAKYIEQLIKLSKKGVDVTLITSDYLKEGDGQYSDLTKYDIIKQDRITDYDAKKKKEKNKEKSQNLFLYGIGIILFSILLSSITNSPDIIYLSFLGGILAIIAIILHNTNYSKPIYSYKYHSIFNLKVFNSQYNNELTGSYLVHSKMYVIDDKVAYLGSVNFTYSGIVKNYECCVKIEDEKLVKKISEEIDKLFNSDELYSKPLEIWGPELYLEPSY